MSGYTPLFGSMLRGTLCGKWPDIGLWGVLLGLADWKGEIDATPQFISSVSGLELSEVTACIQRFCSPDPGSRSKACDGARLVLVDPSRDWGWKVVNIQKYRNMASGSDQIVDGRNAEKVRRYKERHRQTPKDTEGHNATPTHTHTHTQTEEKNKSAATPLGLDLAVWEKWVGYRKSSGKSIKPASIELAQKKLASFGADQAAVVDQSIAQGWTGLFHVKPTPGAIRAPTRTWRPGPEDSGPC